MVENFNQIDEAAQSDLKMLTLVQSGNAPFQHKQVNMPEVLHREISPTAEENKFLVKLTATPLKVANTVNPTYVIVSKSPSTLNNVLSRSNYEGLTSHIVPETNTQADFQPLNRVPDFQNIITNSKNYDKLISGNLNNLNLQEKALVQVYQGTSATEICNILKNSQSTVMSSQLVRKIPFNDNISQQLTCHLDVKENVDKSYSWIAPLNSNVLVDKPSINEGSEEKSQINLQSSNSKHIYKLFHQASHEISESIKQNYDLPTNKQILYNKIDDELGLPPDLRPSIVLQENTFGAPIFAGQKGTCTFRLHAVEVHQFLPMPGQDNPWILENQIDPATTAIFGPMPMPFDPVNSGMVAPTFPITTIQALPKLCPNISSMFNQRLPAIPQSN